MRHDAGDVQETLLMRESHSACLLVVSEPSPFDVEFWNGSSMPMLHPT